MLYRGLRFQQCSDKSQLMAILKKQAGQSILASALASETGRVAAEDAIVTHVVQCPKSQINQKESSHAKIFQITFVRR